MVRDKALLPGVLTKETEDGQRKQFGRLLPKKVGRFHGDFCIVLADRQDSRSGCNLYHVKFREGYTPPLKDPPRRSGSLGDSGDAVPFWEICDANARSRLFWKECIARGSIGRTRATFRQVWDFCHALWVICSGWRLITGVAPVKFALHRELLPGVLTADKDDDLVVQLETQLAEMNYFLETMMEVVHYDVVHSQGVRLTRFVLRDPRNEFEDSVAQQDGWDEQCNVPDELDLEEDWFPKPEDYQSAAHYETIAELLRYWWMFGDMRMSSRRLVELIQDFNLLPGFALHSAPDVQRRRLERILIYIDGFEFDGFMVRAECLPPGDGCADAIFHLEMLEGFTRPAIPANRDASSM